MLASRFVRRALSIVPLLVLASIGPSCADPSGDDAESSNTALTSAPVLLSGPVIIGAGVAGARAAYELRQKGIADVTLIAPAKAAPEDNVPDTGLTTTVPLPNGGTADVGATLFPDTYELYSLAKKLGFQFKEVGTELAIVRRGRPVVIDQANSLTLYKLFTPFELTPLHAAKTQLEITRLKHQGYNHRDGRLYAGESRTIEQYLRQFSGDLPAKYLSVIPQFLAGQDPKSASAGFSQTLFMMNAPQVYTLPQMQSLPLKLIELSGARVELAKVTRVEQQVDGSTRIDGVRASGQPISFTTPAPVVVAATMPIAKQFVQSPTPEENALLANPMSPAIGLTLQLTEGWRRPRELDGVTYGAVPDVERGGGNVTGWGLDFRSPRGTERVVVITLASPVADEVAIRAAIHEADKYLPGIESHVQAAYPAYNPFHAPALTPAFYRAIDTYWRWIDGAKDRRIVLAGSAANQYGMDGASFAGRLAADVVFARLSGR